MKTNRLSTFVSLYLLGLLAIILIALLVKPVRPVPRCQEDVVLVGYGDFERGRWSSYACGPAVDDYIGGYSNVLQTRLRSNE